MIHDDGRVLSSRPAGVTGSIDQDPGDRRLPTALCHNCCCVPDPSADINRDLTALEAELKRLEAEYNMYFAGRLQRPPWETRARVVAMVKRLDRTPINNYGVRFRFTSIQTRFSRFIDLWDRALRAREEGRPGPFMQARQAVPAMPAEPLDDTIVSVTTFTDPTRESDKLQDLYNSLVEAREKAGQPRIPFHRFADLVKAQVTALKEKGESEVAFRVAMKDGKVAFTARALKGSHDEDG